jgi:hypothetical protein
MTLPEPKAVAIPLPTLIAFPSGCAFISTPAILPNGFLLKKSFIQITEFDTKIVTLPAEPIVEVSYTPQAIKYLVEYNIQNIENPALVFTGQIFLYKLPSETLKYNSDDITVDTPIDENDKVFMANLNFQGKSIVETGKIVSDFIKQVYTGIVEINGDRLYLSSGNGTNTDILPFYYRPTTDLYNVIKNYDGFIENRHDQSILSCLRFIHGSHFIPNESDIDLWGEHNLHIFREKLPNSPFWASRIKC